MIWDDVRANWTAYVPRILTRWPDLDEDEVLAISGERPEFTAYLARARGVDATDAEADIGDFLEGLEPADAMMDEKRDNERILASQQAIPTGEDPLAEDRDFGDDRSPEPPVSRTG